MRWRQEIHVKTVLSRLDETRIHTRRQLHNRTYHIDYTNFMAFNFSNKETKIEGRKMTWARRLTCPWRDDESRRGRRTRAQASWSPRRGWDALRRGGGSHLVRSCRARGRNEVKMHDAWASTGWSGVALCARGPPFQYAALQAVAGC